MNRIVDDLARPSGCRTLNSRHKVFVGAGGGGCHLMRGRKLPIGQGPLPGAQRYQRYEIACARSSGRVTIFLLIEHSKLHFRAGGLQHSRSPPVTSEPIGTVCPTSSSKPHVECQADARKPEGYARLAVTLRNPGLLDCEDRNWLAGRPKDDTRPPLRFETAE